MQPAEEVGRTARHYQRLFTLSTLTRQVSIHLVVTLVFLSRLYSFGLPVTTQVLLTILFLFYPLLEQRILLALHARRGFFTVRRALAVNTVSNVVFILPLVILWVIPNSQGFVTYAAGWGMGTSVALRVLVYGAFSELNSAIKGAVAVLPPVAYAAVILLVLPEPVNIFCLVPLPSMSVAALVFIWSVDEAPKGFLPVSGLHLFRSYMYSWVLDEHELLESILKDLSKEYEAEIQAATFETEDERFSLIVPYIHYGPFGGVGSSLFPADLRRRSHDEQTIDAYALHTATSHPLDLPSRAESLRVVDEIIGRLHAPERSSEKITALVHTHLGKASAAGFGFGETAFLCMSYEEMEDVPTSIADQLREKARELGFADAVVVDAHNSLSGETKLFEPHELAELKETATDCLREIKRTSGDSYRVSLCSARPPDLSPAEGLGYAGITVLVWEVSDNRCGLVVVDANNFSPKLRRTILETLKEKYDLSAEVLTTDTHEVTARALVPRGYVILGESGEVSSLLESIEFCVDTALSRLSEGSASYESTHIKTRILGEDGLSAVTGAIDATFRNARTTAVVAFGTAFAASALALLL